MAMVMLAAFLLPLYVFLPIGIFLLALFILTIRFFRVPRRSIAPVEDLILAPADGKVVVIEKVYEDEFLKKECIQVSIFMSIYNVHVNWFPMKGKVKAFKYHPGKYLVARHPKSSELNERTSILMESGSREILVRQIAGFVARRIVCYAGAGKEVSQDEELGFIKFGSRLDLFLPLDAKIMTELGQKTKGGITPIAHL
jgi:phosphatidylserine decarboxylase